jgi:hypothetical protein
MDSLMSLIADSAGDNAPIAYSSTRTPIVNPILPRLEVVCDQRLNELV